MRSDYLTSLRLMRSAYLTSLHITIASLSSHHITPSTHFTHSQCIAFFISTLLCAFKRFTFHQHTHTRTPQHKVSSNGSHFTNTLTLAPLNTRYLQTVHISPTHSHSHPSTQGTFKRFTFHQHTYTRTPQHKVPSNGSHFTNTLTLAPLNTRYLLGFEPQTLESVASVYTFEKSPGYLAHARDPGLMTLLLPSIRLVAILRDPAKRAYSHFQMGCHREKKLQKYRVDGHGSGSGAAQKQSRVEMHNISGVFRENKDGGTVTKFP
jgi:hypothetical protein